MSGIVGMYDRSGAPIERALLQALVHFLSFRGPDARETWSNGPVGLGHTMLRTTRESQIESLPASLNGQFWITADARIDCREELEATLAPEPNAPRRAATDSELILRAYATWGDACVQHLRGDFSFAIWDAQKRILFCARDHFGVRPFYYSEVGELFLFSNTLDCLRQHPEVSDELNDAAIGDFLLFGLNCDVATTTFRAIRRLPAAHTLTISPEGLRIQRYWSAPMGGRIRYHRVEDYIEHFQLLIQAAVADRLRTDRVGILLSGGLDSATIATTARELAKAPRGTEDLRAYTLVFDSLIADQERLFAQQTGDFLKIPIRFIPMDDWKPFERWDDADLAWPEPVDDPFFAGLFDLSRVISADCRVTLSGEGGDNLMFFQMWPYVQDMMRNREWKNLAMETSRYLWIRPSPWAGIRRRAKDFFGKGSTTPSYPLWLADDFANRLNLKERAREWMEPRSSSQTHPVLPKAHASLAIPQWSKLFELQSPGVTRCPLEVRYPFLDLRVVDFLLALPPFPLFFEKKLLRSAAAGRLPESVRTRRKTPLASSPLIAHLRKPQTKWMDRINWHAEMESYVDTSGMAALRSDTPAEQADIDVRPLCLNFWLQSVRSVRYNLDAEVRNG
ncbi:MAG: asparagine synthase-related protein [Candidatus Acidiferrales bacterium]